MTKDHSNKAPNPFKQLADENTPSPQLKKKVLSSAKVSWLIANTLELFSIRAIDSIFELISRSKTMDEL